MTTATKPKKKGKSPQKVEIIRDLSQLELIGEVVTWETANGTFAQVIAALQKASLDEASARRLVPTQAFDRAIKQLSDNRVIDAVRRDKDEVVFQFTKKKHENGNGTGEPEISFEKEAFVRLERSTGKITCQAYPELEKFVQQELDRVTEHRTGGDVSNIVKGILEEKTDLIPLRSAGGAYLILKEQLAVADQLDAFLKELGGYINRFPIPKGTPQGDAAVAISVEQYLKGLLDGLKKKVTDFSASTKPETLTARAKEISKLRVKIEAYATYLLDRHDSLLAEVDEANKELLEIVNKVSEDRKNRPLEDLSAVDKLLRFMDYEKPKKMRELMKEAEVTETQYHVFGKLIEKNVIAKTSAGYVLIKKEEENNG